MDVECALKYVPTMFLGLRIREHLLRTKIIAWNAERVQTIVVKGQFMSNRVLVARRVFLMDFSEVENQHVIAPPMLHVVEFG